MSAQPHIVIIGSGFAGIECTKALKGSGARITLIDRQNHHLFQPLLYQVATAALSAASIAAPIRKVFSKRKDVHVLMGEVTAIDPDSNCVTLSSGKRIEADYIVLAAGLRSVYFGHDDWETHAPPLKSIADAIEIRRRFVSGFECAELIDDEEDRSRHLTFVVIGAGPTGVEMAGAFAELSRKALRDEYRRFDTSSARVILIEGQDRVLNAYTPETSARAKKDLEELGVEVMLCTTVDEMDAQGVTLSDGQRIETETIVWAAGVAGETIGSSLDCERTRDQKLKVEPDLSIPGHPNIFAVGDIAYCIDPKSNKPVPGVAPAAIQMGKFVGKAIKSELRTRTPNRKPFVYRDKGSLATIGRNRAVAEIAGRRFAGYPAFLLWAIVHIYFLIGYRNRIMTMLQWFWQYVHYDRSARVIPARRYKHRDKA